MGQWYATVVHQGLLSKQETSTCLCGTARPELEAEFRGAPVLPEHEHSTTPDYTAYLAKC